mgnify:FL=1
MVEVEGYEVKEGLYYSKDYAWVKVEDGKVRIGITDYAQKQLHEVVFAELPEAGSTITRNEPYGSLESVKAVSDLIAPISGTVVEVNQAVVDNPGLINEDPYGEGWLLVVSPSNLEAELGELMDFNAAVEWHKELVKGS